MIEETPRPSFEENKQENLEKNDLNTSENIFSPLTQVENDKSKELKEKLRNLIEDPGEFRKLASTKAVKEGGRDISEIVEAFHEKYSHWPGIEEETRQIKEYLGDGQKSRWQEKTLESYRIMFPDAPIDQDKWKKTALLVERELRDSRLEEYKRHSNQMREEVFSSQPFETALKVEKASVLRVEGETKAREDRPEHNQDSILVNREKQLYAVFDGLGGYVGGEQAAREAAKILNETLGLEFASVQEMESELVKALETVDQNLFKNNVGLTTSTVAKIWEQGSEKYLVWANVGDSRLFILREGESIRQITVDDNETTQAVEDGTITQQQAEIIDQATSNEALTDPIMKILFNRRNYITNSLGNGRAVIKSGLVHLKPGDKVAITSDGIHDNLTKQEIENILKFSDQAVQSLIEDAEKYSREGHFRSKKDDMSAIVMEI